MLAYRFKPETAVRQAQGDTPDVLSEILQDGVNSRSGSVSCLRT